ncbi:MAG: Hsp20/alpha crystallin family protein [Candidatus Melainabacteria bacterium]|nr:Hsp20/alpha crystallin family protein [Candidatus Melainabacteria bacterium]
MPSQLMDAKKQEVVSENGSEQTRSRKQYSPRTDIFESHDQLLLLADMPGVKQEGIDITLEQNVLTIRGKVETPNFPGYSLAYTEYGVGDFERVFALSNEIDRDGIQATVKNGVLKLILPKSKASLPRKINVQTE